jgi:hypothetical protein
MSEAAEAAEEAQAVAVEEVVSQAGSVVGTVRPLENTAAKIALSAGSKADALVQAQKGEAFKKVPGATEPERA